MKNDKATADAIHAAYLHSLGLTLWEHDGDRWLIPLGVRWGHLQVQRPDPGRPRTSSRRPRGRQIMRLSDHSAFWAYPESSEYAHDRALAAYLAAHTPPQPGERWLLSVNPGGVEQPVEVVKVGGERYFAWQDGTMPTLERVADRDPSTYRRAES